jgi:hypothetical protein
MDGTLGPPTLAGFQSFLVNYVGITAVILPPASLVVSTAFTIATDIVNLQLQLASPDIYTLAVYNLATSNVINFAQDLPNAPPYAQAPPGVSLPFFAYMRDRFNILGPVSGVIQSSSDVSTSESMVVPDWATGLTLADLQFRKDPYGRQYLALAQSYGTLWGIS